MAPKKAQKMSLNAFLGDSSLGSWADEMDSLPTAPAPRTDDDRARNDRRGGDYLSTRPDRAAAPPREDVPLPTQPPYTAFIGNLAFDLTEGELEAFFAPHETKSVKIIRDRDDKPKGFGYIEFADIEGLKAALAKNGASFSNRAIRVNVAEPQKEKERIGGGFDDEKFAGNWRRDGPLPDKSDQRGESRRRFDHASDAPPSISDSQSDWRSSRPPARLSADTDGAPPRRKGSGFSTPDGQPSPADMEDNWSIGSKFKPSQAPEGPGSRFGSLRGRERAPEASNSPAAGESDWRSTARPTRGDARNSSSPTGSTPPTPQLGRRKLELLPRSTTASVNPSPLSSPNPANAGARSNPFGTARPVDVTAKENQVLERIEKEREGIKDKFTTPMSRSSSKQGEKRPPVGGPNGTRSPPRSVESTPRVDSRVRSEHSFAKAASASASVKAPPAVSEVKDEEAKAAGSGEEAVEQKTEETEA